jgi:hypothetical protein
MVTDDIASKQAMLDELIVDFMSKQKTKSKVDKDCENW